MLRLFRNKSGHPLADLKSAQQLLDNLPSTDAVDALQEIGHWIEELIGADNEFRLDHQYAVLRLLDDAAHPHLRKIIQAYFAAVPPSAFQEKRLWGAMNAYFAFSEQGYLHLLRGLRNGGKGSSAIKPALPLISARGIYAVAGGLECAAVRYAAIDPQLWVHLAEFYAYAEAQQCLDDPQTVYAGLGPDISIRSQFAGLLVWFTASVGSLKPLDLHIAKRLITHFSRSFSVEQHCVDDSLFTFDLASPSSPMRVKEEGAAYPQSTRFLSVGAAAGQFDELVKTLAKGPVPQEVNLGVAYGADMVGEVARNLAAFFHAPMPLRRHARRKLKVKMNVASGFSRVLERASVDFNPDATAPEAWEVKDISATGFSFVLPAGRAGHVKIGTLVGLQPENIDHWGAGVVRRLSRDAQNHLHVGVEMLASRVRGVVLRRYAGVNDKAEYPALLLEKPDLQNGENWLLMKADTYSSTRSPTVKMGIKDYLLMPLALHEKGEDYDLARYRRMAQDASGEGPHSAGHVEL